MLPNQVWQQNDQQFKRYSRNCHVLIIWALAVTSTLKIANQSFCMTIWLVMMHHNSEFGNKMLGCLEVIIWKNHLDNHWHFDPSLWPRPWMPQSFYFSQNTLAYNDVLSEQVWLLKNQQFRRYSRKSYFDDMSPHWDPYLYDSKQFLFCITLWLMMLHHHIKFGNKTFWGSEDIIQTNIHWHFELSLWPWTWTQ